MRYLLFIFFLSSFFGFSQKSETITKSTMNAYVYDNPSNVSITLCELKKNTKVTVEAYSGFNYWQVKTKKCSGYVGTIVLIVNEEMKKMKLEYEETLYNKAEKERKQFEKERELELELEENKLKQEKLLKEKKKKFKSDSIKEALSQRIKYLEEQKKIKDSLNKVDLRTNCHYKRNEIDEFDKIKIIETDYYGVKSVRSNSYYLAIKLKKYGNRNYVYLSLDDGLGCVSPYSNDRSFVKFKLENNDIITIYHSGDIDCSNDFTLIGELSNSEIIRLKKTPISTIRLQGTEYRKDLDDIDYKEFFIDKLKCIE